MARTNVEEFPRNEASEAYGTGERTQNQKKEDLIDHSAI